MSSREAPEAAARRVVEGSPLALVTGATGFVGSHVAERLAVCGWRLCALVRPASDTALLERLGADRRAGDLADGPALERAARGVDVVLHLAGVTSAGDEATYREVNAEGTRRVIGAARSAGVRRLVYLSSYAAGGPAPDVRPRRLIDAPAPLTAYGRSKLAGEAHGRQAAGDGLAVVVVRAPVVYGPGDRALLPYFRLVRRGLAPVPRGPDRSLQLLYAPDLAAAVERAARGGPGAVAAGTYAVAEPAVRTFSEVAWAIGEAVGRRPRLLSVPFPVAWLAAALGELASAGRGPPPPFNRDKVREMLADGWVHELFGAEELLSPERTTSLAAGLAQTARWYLDLGLL